MYKLTFLNKSGEVDLDIIAGKIISNNIQCNGVSMYSETPDKFDIFTKENPEKVYNIFKTIITDMKVKLLKDKQKTNRS